MKRLLLISLLLHAFIFVNAHHIYKGVSSTKKSVNQTKEALEFTKKFISKNYEACWKMFDKKTNSTMNFGQFQQAMEQMRLTLPSDEDNIELFMTGVKFVDGKQYPYYSLKYVKDIAKPASFIFDVVFVDKESKLIAGFQPKRMLGNANINQASSSKGNETVVSKRDTVMINSEQRILRGVNIIHFKNNTGIVSIQVEQVLPKDQDLKKWTYSSGIQYAKWLYKQPTYQEALTISKKEGRTLNAEIGVSFINPQSGAGYNVLIKEADYK